MFFGILILSEPKFFLDANFFHTQTFFQTQTFFLFNTNFFSGRKFFRKWIMFRPTFVFGLNFFFRPDIFQTQNFLEEEGRRRSWVLISWFLSLWIIKNKLCWRRIFRHSYWPYNLLGVMEAPKRGKDERVQEEEGGVETWYLGTKKFFWPKVFLTPQFFVTQHFFWT